eukprot:m51a1_g12768 hypothetical protein (261) ;mRNA; r:2457-3450
MSTRTERVFAAFQGPVLSVGVPVVHMYRAYTAELLLPLRWRRFRSLGPRDVLEALSRATVRAEASVLSPPLRCASCGDVVTLCWAQRTREGLPDDLECYSATLRSKCTSSKRHLRSETVVLAVDVGGVLVCSEPFAVFARQPGRQAPRECAAAARSELAVAHVGQSPRPRWLVLVVNVHSYDARSPFPPAVTSMIADVADVLRSVPTFVMQKCAVTPGASDFGRHSGQVVAEKYTRNVIRNSVNTDIVGLVQMLASFSNC